LDGALTTEVFKNLIDNAVKFNDKDDKRIKITAQQDGKIIKINFEDNGVGIPVEERVKIFQKFYQIENSFTGQVPGAGLGLALCRRVVEEMEGDIQVQSELGHGSTFTVILPCR
jgi:two-component system phosphate regulon sensor histidine kinase PhoR